MKDTKCKEKRKHQRLSVSLPVQFHLDGKEGIYSGVTLDLSESGLLIQTFEDMLVSTRLKINVLFPRGFELSNFRGVTEIIWKEIYYWDDWEGYQYGLKFIEILDKDHLLLKRLLSDPSFLKEAYLFDEPQHQSALIIKIR